MASKVAKLDTVAPSRRAKGPKQVDTSSALAALRSFIQDGDYQSGAKLPPERTLAGVLNLGRPALREAIKALSILDVLESCRGDGTYVKSLNGLSAGWPTTIEIPEAKINMLELLELRKMIEPRAAALAATRVSVDLLQEIERTRASLENASDDWQTISALDFSLHQLIVSASGNTLLVDVYKYLSPLLLKSREITGRSAPDWERMKKDHEAIVKAIARGESQAAEQAMMEHLHHVGFDLIAGRKR